MLHGVRWIVIESAPGIEHCLFVVTNQTLSRYSRYNYIGNCVVERQRS